MSECGCGHCHCHNESHNDGVKVLIIRLVVGVVVAVAGIIFDIGLLFAAAYVILGYDVLINAVKNIFKGKALDENFLMTVAALGAFALGERLEACAVMMFYQIGEILSHYAVERSRSSIAALTEVRPDTARLLTADGESTIACQDIKVGNVVLVGAGERIPVDGTIIKGSAMVDTSSLTGEYLPRHYDIGDEVLAGMISTDGSLEIETKKEFGESMLSRILKIAEEAHEKKASAERFITTFAKFYTPIVVIMAVLLAFLPPIFKLGSFSVWGYRALSFLVISCPCALVVSVPLTFFAGIGGASKMGVLIKSGLALEKLSKVKTVAFDKTGTVTVGTPVLTEIRVNGSKAELLELAAYAECDSNHPIANSIKAAYGREIDRNRISDICEISARGVEAVIDARQVLAGSERLFDERGIEITNHGVESSVYVAVDGKCLGYIAFADKVKNSSKTAISEIEGLGIATVMLSGDNAKAVRRVATEVGINDVYSELMPAQKAEYINKLSENGHVLFVGDGINDAPALASASVGAAMGGIGSDAAIESADVVVMGDELLHIPKVIKHSLKVMTIARENIIISLGLKFLIMLISIFGMGGMWPAIFADVGLCIITVINALRAYYVRIK